MSVDPMLGGATVSIDPTTATTAQLAKLAGGGITGGQVPQPKTELTHRYAAPINTGVAPQRQAPSVNRNMVIAGYKGKADAWIKCLKEVLHVHGAQVDRSFYLALDPREAHRQAELMEVGSQAFSTFVCIPYRDNLEGTPIGLPASRNLHSFVGTVMEQYRNVGPILIVLPFHMLMPGGFDFIERNYTHASSQKGVSFLGYEVNRPDGKRPGSAIVLPPLWARHPDFPLAKGLSQFSAGQDIDYIKDEILRAMRPTDTMIGHGMKPGAGTAIQTFAADEIMDTPKPPAFNPNGRPNPPADSRPLPQNPQQQFSATVASVPPTRANIAPAGPVTTVFNDEEKAAILVLISQLGHNALKTVDAARYGVTLAADPSFAEQAHNKAQGYKIRAGKQAKAAK